MTFVLAFVIFIILIVADIKIYRDKMAMIAKIDAYKKEIEDIKTSNEHLEVQINNANNKDYLEQMAYEKFDKHRPGEQEIIFVSGKENIKTPENKKNYWLGWIGGVISWFKDIF